MKTHIPLLPALLVAGIIIPCCEISGPAQPESKEIVLRKKSAEIIEADQEFAFELFRETCSLSDSQNIMISPLSVSYALGMALNGAAGTTLDAFYEVLHFGELTNEEVNESYRDLIDQVVHLDDKVEFAIANSIWYKLGFDVLDEFITTNADYFDALASELDFSDPNSVDMINQWIEEKTNDKIRDMLDYIPRDAVMYLINAIYFNARWKYRFDKSKTHEGTFYMEDGSTQQADFMKTEGLFNYTVTEEFTAVELPYGDSTFSMVAILPDEGISAGELAGRMDITKWKSWFAQPSLENIRIELPKFKYGFKDLLNEQLINLGLGVAFSGAADFSRINPGGGLFISRVIHQTFIDVQEEGTEAAAATIVEITRGDPPPTPLFRANRPFLYVIRENSSGAILFMGKTGMPV